MASIDEVIQSLAEEAVPLSPAKPPVILFLQWVLGCLLYIGVLLAMFGIRDDLADHWQSFWFTAEVGLLVCLLLSSLLSATALSFPDMYQKNWLSWLPLLPLVLFVGVLVISWQHDVPPSPRPQHDYICLACITLFSFMPAGWMFYSIRKYASTHFYLSGATALLAASSLGCLALRLSEKTDSISHLVEWHYLPMVGFSLLGLWLGKIFLKW